MGGERTPALEAPSARLRRVVVGSALGGSSVRAAAQ